MGRILSKAVAAALARGLSPLQALAAVRRLVIVGAVAGLTPLSLPEAHGAIIVGGRNATAFAEAKAHAGPPGQIPPPDKDEDRETDEAPGGISSFGSLTADALAQVPGASAMSQAGVSGSIVLDLSSDTLTVTAAGSANSSVTTQPNLADRIFFGTANATGLMQLSFNITDDPYEYEISASTNIFMSRDIPGNRVGTGLGLGGSGVTFFRISDDNFRGRQTEGSSSGILPPGQYGISASAGGGIFAGQFNSRFNYELRITPIVPDVRWDNAAGGLFDIAENWRPQRVPTPEDAAVFDLRGTYTVQLDQDVTNKRLRANGAGVNVTFDLNGHRYTADRFNGGGLPGDDVSITFKGGGGPVVAAAGMLRAAADGDGEVRFQDELLIKKGLRLAYVEGAQAFNTLASVDGNLTITDPGTTANMLLSPERRHRLDRIDHRPERRYAAQRFHGPWS